MSKTVLKKILADFTTGVFTHGADGIDDTTKQTVMEIQELITKREREARIDELEKLSFEVVEPCEPDCDEVRHALHQGSWNAHLKIENRIAELNTSEGGE